LSQKVMISAVAHRSSRILLNSSVNGFQVGSIAEAMLAWLIIPNYNWRYVALQLFSTWVKQTQPV
jgi:hypothetical protein